MRRAVLLALGAGLCAGCPGGQGDGGNPDGGATLAISPSSATVFATAAPVLFTAQVTNSSASVSWSLSPSVGSIQDLGGGEVAYTAPTTVSAPTSVTLSAALAGTSLTAQASITVNPGGTLILQVHAPPLLAASIDVTGPGGYDRTLTGATSLTGIPPGTYVVDAGNERVPGPIADLLYGATVAGSPAAVTDGQSVTVTVTYAQQGGTGSLWIPNPSLGTVSGLPVSQSLGMVDGGTAVPLTSSASPAAVAVDGNGALWSVDAAARTVSRYTAASLMPLGIADLVFGDRDAGFLSGPVSVAFDSQGNLWVANAQDELSAFSPSALATANPAPSIQLTDVGDGTNDVVDLAFDARGGLWVAHGGGALVCFTGTSALSGKVSPTPSTRLTVSGTPRGIAFDAQGNLWLALAGSVAELSASSLVATGSSPAPVATLQGTDADGGVWFTAPDDLAFDNAGNLWVTSSQLLLQYTQTQSYAGTVAIMPDYADATPGWARAGKPAFDPPPPNLPLNP